ncbi:PhzF family phenazine biosynthesis protein [Pseudomonas sp. Marseille-Q5115]|uniref:PhzF family phenazine biosynthesis protein n=1 Tax=Pseudomonas sp. Marseille-Q5115 TaxID=2866593 RepID=UPI001CE4B534|nr:PhzF family phenazine biosynthesis protein [Pseudomonas sp. Marseille-Q5115]
MPTRPRSFKQVDVFTATPLLGNPLAVVLDAGGLSNEQMQAFARWTNLSETTFVLPPTTAGADYRVRIFTAVRELPFAGHPTLGTCHAWLEAGGKPQGEEIIQECGVGLVRVREQTSQLAFVCPPLLRSGSPTREELERACRGLRLDPTEVVSAEWVDNGAGWLALRLRDRPTVLGLEPDYAALKGLAIGVFAPWNEALDGGEAQFEVRAFIADDGMPEDPVTGSLNAGIAQWLHREGLAPDRFVVSQGTVLGRAGRVYVERSGKDIWLGGHVSTCIDGQVRL